MPHVTVKMFAGRSKEQKQSLADAILEAFKSTLGSKDDSVSIAIEDVSPEHWDEDVYEREIVPNAEKLFKKPGYGSLK